MKRNCAGSAYFLPLTLRGHLVMKTPEMMLASAQVIGHRTGGIVLAGPAPNASDRCEFALMGQEKIEAAAHSAHAMAAQTMAMSQPWGALAVCHMLRNSAALMSLASSRTPSQFVARQAALGQSAVGTTDVSKSAAKPAHRGQKPIHAKATANARQLGKR